MPTKVVVDRRWINLEKLWKAKYSAIWKKKNLKFTFFIGGPCRPEIAYAIGYTTNNVVESDECCVVYTDKSGMKLIYGRLESVTKAMKYTGICYVFSGYAGWERTQLLAECSRRHWWVAHGKLEDTLQLDGIWERLIDSGRCLQPAMSEYNQPDFGSDDEN